jgi:hypothetical protein
MLTYLLVRVLIVGVIGAVLFVAYKLVDNYLNKKMKNL